MGIELVAISLAAGAIPTLIRLLQDVELFQPVLNRVRRNQILVKFLEFLGVELAAPTESYQERLNTLLAKFTEVSNESEAIVVELQSHIHSKEAIVRDLEQKEKDLSSRIDQMKESPEFVIARIQELTEEIAQLQKEASQAQARDSRQSKLRDFGLFALGVIVSYGLQWLGPRVGVVAPPTP